MTLSSSSVGGSVSCTSSGTLRSHGVFFRTLTADEGFAQKMGDRFGMENKGIQYTIANKALSQIAKMRDVSRRELKNLYPNIEDNRIPIE